ncbi:PAS domain-containing protein [Streptomyces griseoluteus]|uniref:PAS domain-containing protein n=1 Tax=Streptomyces griseoluteus TaxID=29306 RepID=UPI0036F8B25A
MRTADDGRIVEWSARAACLLGLSREQAAGRTVTDSVGGDDGATGRSALPAALGAASVRPVVSGGSLIREYATGSVTKPPTIPGDQIWLSGRLCGPRGP